MESATKYRDDELTLELLCARHPFVKEINNRVYCNFHERIEEICPGDLEKLPDYGCLYRAKEPSSCGYHRCTKLEYQV